MYPLPQPWALRHADTRDEAFLESLYFSSRDDLHQALVDPGALARLVSMQYQMLRTGVERDFPGASRLVLLCEGEPAGQLIVHTGPTDVRLVDMSILPAQRRRGAARSVVLALQAEARRAGLGVSLAVARSNRAAAALYAGLGFTPRGGDLVFEQLSWRAE